MRRPARREDRMASPRAMAARAAARWRPSACQHRGRWVGHLAALACVFARARMQRRAAAAWAKVAHRRTGGDGLLACVGSVFVLVPSGCWEMPRTVAPGFAAGLALVVERVFLLRRAPLVESNPVLPAPMAGR